MKNYTKIISNLLPAATILAMLVLSACSGSAPTNFCHATGDEANPYEEITADATNVDEHMDHPGDLWPVPANGCPTTLVTVVDGKITICHATSSETNPYNEITISVNGLNGHANHERDLIPAPAGGCPDSTLETSDGKITICHATSSEKNPYNEITISVNGLNGHDKHEGDIIPAPAGGCPQ
ncbi:MAG: hypothetical protein WEC37_00640 [Anaerolineales bacterium]